MSGATVSSEAPITSGVTGKEYKALNRNLTLLDAFFLIIGNTIGVGIFLSFTGVAAFTGSPWWFIFAWLIGGGLAFLGALSMAELGVRMPKAGGDYVYLTEAYGPAWGFIYGYLGFFFTYTGSIALMATAVMQYQGPALLGPWLNTEWVLFGFWTLSAKTLMAVALIFAITGINIIGIRNSVWLQKLVTLAPLAFLVTVGISIVFSGADAAWAQHLSDNLSKPIGLPSGKELALAMVPIFWTYAGWNVVTYLSEDVQQPKKNIPRSLALGVVAITLIYLLFTLVILATHPFETVSAQNADPMKIVSESWAHVIGGAEEATFLIAAVVFLLTLGGMNSTILAGSRVFLALSRDGFFHHYAKRIHPKFHTPAVSLLAQAMWASLLILFTSDFLELLQTTSFVMMVLSMFTVGALIVLRHRHRNDQAAEKQFKTPLYPLPPVLYLVISGAVFFYSLNDMKIAFAWMMVTIIFFSIYAAISSRRNTDKEPIPSDAAAAAELREKETRSGRIQLGLGICMIIPALVMMGIVGWSELVASKWSIGDSETWAFFAMIGGLFFVIQAVRRLRTRVPESAA